MDDYLRRYNNWKIAFFLLFFVFSSKVQIWKTGPDIKTKALLFGYKRRRLYPRGAYIQNYRVQGKKMNLGPFILKVMRRSVCISCMAQTRRDESFKTYDFQWERFFVRRQVCAAMALLYGDMLELNEKISSETDSVLKKITPAKILININVIYNVFHYCSGWFRHKNPRIVRKIHLDLTWKFLSWRGLLSKVLLCATGVTNPLD